MSMNNDPADELKSKVEEVYDLIHECERIATEHKLKFSLEIAYGMGGTFIGDPEEGWTDYDDEDPVRWYPSSQSC